MYDNIEQQQRAGGGPAGRPTSRRLLQGQTMTDESAPPMVRTARPAWVSAIGLLSILMAAQSFLSWARRMQIMSEFLQGAPSLSALSPWNYVFTFGELVHSVLLLIGGVLLLKLKPAARGVLLAYAILYIGSVLLSFASLCISAFLVSSDATSRGSSALQQGIYGALLRLPSLVDAYPIFCLIWFFRRGVAQEMRSWTSAPDAGGHNPTGQA
jgi:hypothetical protein